MEDDAGDRWWEELRALARRGLQGEEQSPSPAELAQAEVELAAELARADSTEVPRLGSVEVEALIRRAKMHALLGQADANPHRPRKVAAAASRGPERQTLKEARPIAVITGAPGGVMLVAGAEGELAIEPSPLPQFTHLRVGAVVFPLARNESSTRVPGAGRAAVEDYLRAESAAGRRPVIELIELPR